MMMERISLGVLYLSGWHVFCTCLQQYHYVAEFKTWNEAQTYCRETYTDLATIENTEDMNRLINTVPPAGHHCGVWIGLYGNINWRWSDNDSAYDRSCENLNSSEQNVKLGSKSCVKIENGRLWVDDCSKEISCICYNGTQLDPEFIYMNKRRTWSSAQRYCRENFTDLATVRNDTEKQEIQDLVPCGYPAWTGLYGCPQLHWSDGSGSLFTYWDYHPYLNSLMSMVCVFAHLQRSGQWWAFPCDFKLPFICYSITPAAPAMRRAVMLRMKKKSFSVDLNDPSVKAGLLKRLQERLKEKGVSGVTLKWREQTAGNVFRKEGRSSPKKNRKKTEV